MGISNRDWLYSLEPSELSAWFDADCSDTESVGKLTAERDAAYAKNRALKQHIANMQEGRNGWHTKADKLQAKVTELTAERNELQVQVDTLKSCHCPHYHVNEHTCDVHETSIAELTAERDKLKELNEYHALQYELASEDADRLQAQVDELTAERDNLEANNQQLHTLAGEQAATIDELQKQLDELTNAGRKMSTELGNMQDYITKVRAERERYRSMCSEMATKIHDALMVMDEGMA